MDKMKKNTIIDYTNAVRAKYEKEKKGQFHSFLENLSPAQIREFCLLKFDNGLDPIDETIFRIYFTANDSENLRNKIYNYETSKLKSIGSFLSEINKSTSILNLNLIAVLVDFSPRPFNKFSKLGLDENEVEKVPNSINQDFKIEKTYEINFQKIASAETNQKAISNTFYKKIAIFTSLFLLFGFGYTMKNAVFPKEECMQWKKDHYEAVSCTSDRSDFVNLDVIKPIDKLEFSLKKIMPTSSTTYFKNGKPMVWYYKKVGVIELFNRPGRHPENGKTLKEITPYIIDKYLKKK